MTPTDPNPTAPPTVAPASDEEIARIEPNIAKTEWQTCSNCDAGLRSINTPPYLIGTHEDYCILTMWPKVIARIEAERAENDRLRFRLHAITTAEVDACVERETLRARVAELEAALSELETRIFALGSDSPICQLHRLKLSGLVDFIHAALKPEPAKEKP